MKRVLVTGSAGFIGFHLASALKKRGDFVVGLDEFNSYYQPRLKEKRAEKLASLAVTTHRLCLSDFDPILSLLEKEKISHIVHLAAQAGVRHSLLEPNAYVESNLQGFVSILEAARRFPGMKLVYASSSSVYGANRKTPFAETDPTDAPTNLYGATKKANELMAHAYHHLYGLSVTGLRYFTVYGPWGRPDMAYYRFSDQILKGEPIRLFNHGKMRRDFTYIDDIIAGTLAAIDRESALEVFNLGNHKPIELLYFIELLEKGLGKKAKLQMEPMQPGEVLETYADIEKSQRLLGFQPKTTIEEGISRFLDWYQQERV
jgi:UDP-glucuronate 4-epimerase